MGRPPRIHREQILHTARKVFSSKGFASATLTDIATELHVTAAAVLRHFDSKQALFDAAMHSDIQLPACITDLQHVDAASDPRVVLRRVAEEWVPFAKTTIAQHLVLSMHEQTNPTRVVPFDPRNDDSPPRRGLKIVSGYFRRAHQAGVIRIEDPRAAALLFMGSLLSYVFLHQVLRAVEPAYPLADYIDALIDVWTRGAIVPKKRGGSIGRSKQVTSQADRSDRHHRDRGDRAPAVHEAEKPAQTARAFRNAGSANSQRGVSRRRTRNPRPRR